MNIAVRTVFVGDGSPDRVASATPAPTERLASWVSIVGGGLTAPLPAPPEAATWERALANLQAARVLYLAPGEGRDDDPGVAVLLDLADRGVLTFTVGPERAPATDGPTVTGPGPHGLAARAGDAERGAWDCRRRRAEGLAETPAHSVWGGRGNRDSAVVVLAVARGQCGRADIVSGVDTYPAYGGVAAAGHGYPARHRAPVARAGRVPLGQAADASDAAPVPGGGGARGPGRDRPRG